MKKALFFCLCIALSGPLFAGDVAKFINLGFSDDGNYFMLGQYGFSSNKSETYASIFTIDVRLNVFVPNGVFSQSNQSWLEPGDSADGSLLTLIEKIAPVRLRYGINYTKKGRLLYISSSIGDNLSRPVTAISADSTAKAPDAETAKNNNLTLEETATDEALEVPTTAIPAEDSNTIVFTDFQKGTKYAVKLEQVITGSGATVSSSFKILLSVTTANGVLKSFTVGHPNFVRKGISGYNIEQVILSPNDNMLVFVVSRGEYDPNGGDSLRYMIETIELK